MTSLPNQGRVPASPFLPDHAKVYFETHGCSASQADSEMMQGLLQQKGYSLVQSEEESDANVIVTCTAKSSTAQRMAYRIKSLGSGGKPLVVSGCMPKTERASIEKINDRASLVGPNSIESIVDALRISLQRKKGVFLEDGKRPKLGLPRSMFNPVIGIVEIASGCLGGCTFCQVKLAKGVLVSYPVETVAREVEELVGRGCKEIWLTSTDNGPYGRDIGSSLTDLVERVGSMQGEFMVRIGMMNPLFLPSMMDELITSMRSDRFFKFLHLPVQSGSHRVLRLMRRGHTTREYAWSVRRFREAFPMASIATDLIVGFPTEDDLDFQETVKLIIDTEPDVVNVSKFGARPGTEAALMDQLPAKVIKERSQIISRVVRETSLKRNEQWVGWEGQCLVDEVGKLEGTWVGRNLAYKPIVVKSPRNLLGRLIRVRILQAKPTHLVAEMA